MEALELVLLTALLLEAVIQVIKGWVPETVETPGWLWPVCAAALGVALCLMARADVFQVLGVPLMPPPVGMACTGLLISRGSNFLHDLLRRVRGEEV